MASYTQTTFFAPKDALASNDPLKVIKGADVDPEFSAISTAIGTKVDKTITLTATAPLTLGGTAGAAGDLSANRAIGVDRTGTDGTQVGYLDCPQNAQTGNYTLVLTDRNKHIYHASGGSAGITYTIPANASVAFPIGSMITFVNQHASTISIAITSDSMTLAGTSSTGTRTLAVNGMATAVKVTATTWLISGTGLS